ncbi:hypothetical protein TNCV_1144671 [Trichonephila clavipes]|nr:hypothetical protein TNCV_1144671 [Trichonephila clavipes]
MPLERRCQIEAHVTHRGGKRLVLRLSLSAALSTIQRPEESRHNFRTKTFRKDRVCDVCQLPIDYQGNSCKNCKYVCHKECEMKVSFILH